MNRKQRRQQKKKNPAAQGRGAAGVANSVAGGSSGGVSGALLANAGINLKRPAPTLNIEATLAEALSHHQSNRLDQAESLYRLILQNAPKNSRALHLLGLIAHQRGQSEKAVELIERSLVGNPMDAEAHNNLGNALRRLGRVEEAVQAFGKAVDCDPEFSGAYSNLGLTLRQLGRFDEAAHQFREALKRAPALAEAWSGLARTGRLTFEPGEAMQAESVLNQGKLSNSDRRHLHYALGKYYDDSAEWDRAFSHFEAANNLREGPATSDIPINFMASMVDHFGGGQQTNGQMAGSVDQDAAVPIFIFGMPRSGTTLAEQILASHPLVRAGGELNVVEATLTKQFPGAREGQAPDSDDITPEILENLRHQFFDCFADSAPGGQFLTDKSPFNFMYFPILCRAFPQARFIHCRRDPLDTCLSIYFTDFTQDRAFATDLGTIGAFYDAYQKTTESWRRSDMGQIHEFGYEAILGDQESETRQLLDFCGLPWDNACLNFYETNRQVATPSDWQVRLPIFATSQGRWHHYEKYLAPLIKKLES